MIDLTYFV